MSRNGNILFSCLLGIGLLLSIQRLALADVGNGLETSLSIGMGWERLEYEEHEPDSGLRSNSAVTNTIVGFDGLKRWPSVFGAVRATIPVSSGPGTEEWTASGPATFQSNTITYGWTRMDGSIGYPLHPYISPYAGMRWSESKQDRREFVVNNTAVAGTAKETVRSWSVLLGVRGGGNITTQWRWNYRLNVFVPIDVQVVNSTIPEFDASDHTGYTLALNGGVTYALSQKVSIGLLIHGGRMHWSGSAWQPSAGRLVKWPENNTDFLGGMLSITYHP